MIEHIFVDLDGTVWDLTSDSKKILRQIYSEISKDYKLPDFELFYFNYNKINLDLWEEYKKNKINRAMLEAKRFKDTFNNIGVFYDNIIRFFETEYLLRLHNNTTLFEGAFDVIKTLSKYYKIHVISNGFKEVQYKKMKDTGLSDLFTNIFISEEVGIMKPELEMFYYAMKTSGTNVENSYMIGDDIQTDLLPAKIIGIKQIFFNPFHKKNEHDFTLTVDKWQKIEDYFLNKLALSENSNSINATSNLLP